MNKCFNCGKGVIFGRSHTHHRGVAGGRWKKRAPKTRRVFEPNLQSARILVEGDVRRVKLCMSCLSRIKKDIKDGKKPRLQLLRFENRKPGRQEERTQAVAAA